MSPRWVYRFRIEAIEVPNLAPAIYYKFRGLKLILVCYHPLEQQFHTLLEIDRR